MVGFFGVAPRAAMVVTTHHTENTHQILGLLEDLAFFINTIHNIYTYIYVKHRYVHIPSTFSNTMAMAVGLLVPCSRPAEDKPWHNGGQLGMQVELAFGSWMPPGNGLPADSLGFPHQKWFFFLVLSGDQFIDLHMVYIWFIYGLYMVYIWFIFGLYMVYIWFIYGLYLVYIWLYWFIYGLYGLYGLSWYTSWDILGMMWRNLIPFWNREHVFAMFIHCRSTVYLV